MQKPEDVVRRFQEAWNVHDMQALGALFDADARFANRFGHLVRGIDAIVALHESIHRTIYGDSALENELADVVPVGEGAVAVYFWCRLTAGPAHPAGPHKVDTLILALLARQGEQWRIKALENVTLVDPRTGQAVLRGEPGDPGAQPKTGKPS